MSANTCSTETQRACVKWFNNKKGFGFLTVLSGDKKDTDIFVHHSSIEVSTEQYKYLVQGEYVEFVLCETDQANHHWIANNVKGVNGGKLMCETRYQSKDNTVFKKRTDKVNYEKGDTYKGKHVNVSSPVLREGEEWLLIKRKISNTQSNNYRK
jgi:CspA family cold shock protein